MPIEGIDISHHQGTVDWRAVAGAGIRFAYLKATEGSTFRDDKYYVNSVKADEAGVAHGAYHFYRHDILPVPQARHFIDTIGAVAAGELPPMLDVEGPGDGAGPINYPLSEVAPRLRAFLTTVDQALGKQCGVYTYPHVWRNILGNPTDFTDRPLWIAHYGVPQPGPLPGGWQDYAVWQYTSTGTVPGVAGRVDRNRFNGDEAAFRMFAGLTRSRRFPTGQYLAGGFLDLWESNPDAVTDWGYPVRGEESGDTWPYKRLPELAGYTVQVLERALFVYKPGEQARADGRIGAVLEVAIQGV